MKVVFGSRGSALALAQTRWVMAQFQALHPQAMLELRVIKTTGDLRPDAPLAAIGGLGAFTAEIENALLRGDIDAAVHSLKDLPTRQPEGLRVTAIAGREDPADMLVTRDGCSLHALPENAAVGTSSLRRKVQLLALRPDLRIVELRGNVPTRLQRVQNGDVDAAVIAAAGLTRLGLAHEPGLWKMPLSLMLPAAGQGALAIETRQDAAQLAAMLAPLHDAEAAAEVHCERAVLQAFGGGCRSPLGVYARVRGSKLELRALAANEDMSRIERCERSGVLADAESLGRAVGEALRRVLMEANASALSGRRIAVTRPADQALSFGKRLEDAGALVFYLPLIAIAPVTELAHSIDPDDYDWVVFTSVNAVASFHAHATRLGWTPADYKRCRIAAIGAATAAALETLGMPPEIVPDTHVSAALAAAVSQAESSPGGRRVLLPQSDKARPNLAAALTDLGMAVQTTTTYRTVDCPPSEEARTALLRFAPDAVSFFSPSAVDVFQRAGLADVLPTHAVYGAVGPVTADVLRQAGFTPLIEAEQQSETSLLEALARYFSDA